MKNAGFTTLAIICFLYPSAGFGQTTGISLDDAAATSGSAVKAPDQARSRALAARALENMHPAQAGSVDLSGINWHNTSADQSLNFTSPAAKNAVRVPPVSGDDQTHTITASREIGAGATLKKAFLGLAMIPYVTAKAGIAVGLAVGEFVKHDHPALGVAVQVLAVPVGLVLGLAVGLVIAPVKFVMGIGSATVKLFRGKF